MGRINLYNAQGYLDTTAYEALNRIERENRKKTRASNRTRWKNKTTKRFEPQGVNFKNIPEENQNGANESAEYPI